MDIETPVAPIPDPDDCVSRTDLEQGVVLPIMSRLDVRIHPDHAVAGSGREAAITGWIRFSDGRPVDAHSLPLFADAVPSATLLQGRLHRLGAHDRAHRACAAAPGRRLDPGPLPHHRCRW